MLIRLQSLHGLIKSRQMEVTDELMARLYGLLEAVTKGDEPRKLKFQIIEIVQKVLTEQLSQNYFDLKADGVDSLVAGLRELRQISIDVK